MGLGRGSGEEGSFFEGPVCRSQILRDGKLLWAKYIKKKNKKEKGGRKWGKKFQQCVFPNTSEGSGEEFQNKRKNFCKRNFGLSFRGCWSTRGIWKLDDMGKGFERFPFGKWKGESW